MAAWKLLVLYGLWLLASAAVAIAAGGFVGITAGFFGMSRGGASVVFDVVAVAVFVAAASLPFLMRRRVARTSGEGDQG
jgi:hypothetical protein